MTFAALIDRRAADNPDGSAVADSSHSLSNSALLGRVRASAAQLADLGVGPGDVVALRLVNRVEFVVLLFAAWAAGRNRHPGQPRPDRRRGRAPARRLGCPAPRHRGRDGRPHRSDDAGRLGRAWRRDVRSGVARRRCVGVGPADLQVRHHRDPQGRDARPRQPRRHGNDGPRRAGSRSERPLPAGPAALPRQRHRRQRAAAAARRGRRRDRRPVQPGDVLRHRRSEPADLLLGRADDLQHAHGAAGRGTARHVVDPVRRLWRRPRLGRAPHPVRDPVRVPAGRGVRTLRGNLRLDQQSRRGAPQTRHRRAAVPRPGAADPRRRRQRVARRAARGDRGPWGERHARIPRAPRGHGGRRHRRLAAHRRHRAPRRGRLPDDLRSFQGDDHPRRGEHLPEGDRGRAHLAPHGAGSGRHRHA